MSEIERLAALARYACERDRVPVDVTEAPALTERWRGVHASKQGEALLLEPSSLSDLNVKSLISLEFVFLARKIKLNDINMLSVKRTSSPTDC